MLMIQEICFIPCFGKLLRIIVLFILRLFNMVDKKDCSTWWTKKVYGLVHIPNNGFRYLCPNELRVIFSSELWVQLSKNDSPLLIERT